MKKWIFAAALLAGFNAGALAETCRYTPPPVTPLPSTAIDSPRLVLTGPTVLELGLAQTPATLAHGPDLLIAKYANGALLSHRELSGEELRPDTSSSLSLPDYVRLLFLQTMEGATEQDRQEATLQREALRLGCSVVTHHLLDGVEIFSYSQTRIGGERYHAYFILTGNIVHYLDVVATDAFAKRIISTLKKRT